MPLLETKFLVVIVGGGGELMISYVLEWSGVVIIVKYIEMTVNINVFGTIFIEHIIVSNQNSTHVILVYSMQS